MPVYGDLLDVEPGLHERVAQEIEARDRDALVFSAAAAACTGSPWRT